MENMRTTIYDYVKWGNKTTNEVSKKIALNAVDYDAEFLMQSTEPGQEKIKFVDVCRVPVANTEFFILSEALFKRAANEILKKSFKAREATQDTILCDLAYISKDFHILRVRSFMMYKDSQHTRVTKIMVHKLNGWDDVKAANKTAMELKNGSLGFSKETCVFELVLLPYPTIQGNWQDAQDLITLNSFARKLETMFEKPSSYGSFLDRVYESKNNENNSGQYSQQVEKVGQTVVTGDEEFPF